MSATIAQPGVSWGALLGLSVAALLTGYAWGDRGHVFIPTTPEPQIIIRTKAEPGIRPVGLTAAQKARPVLTLATVPETVILRVLPVAEFHARFGDDIAGVSQFSLDGTLACEVFIPAGWIIASHPAKGRATFIDQGNRGYDDVLAHELLHCQNGDWHPDD